MKSLGKIMLAIILVLIVLGPLPMASCYTVGVKSGDWIEYDVQENNDYTQKIEYLSISGTTVTLNNTITQAGTLDSSLLEFDLTTTEDHWITYLLFSERTLMIPNDTSVGDSVWLGLFGNETISGKTTRTYADVDRTVVYANFSFQQSGMVANHYTFYWDKKTGVLVEETRSYESVFWSLSTTDTNMWIAGIGWWFWIIIAIVIAGGIISTKRNTIRRLWRKPQAPGETAKKTLNSVPLSLFIHLACD